MNLSPKRHFASVTFTHLRHILRLPLNCDDWLKLEGFGWITTDQVALERVASPGQARILNKEHKLVRMQLNFFLNTLHNRF